MATRKISCTLTEAQEQILLLALCQYEENGEVEADALGELGRWYRSTLPTYNRLMTRLGYV